MSAFEDDLKGLFAQSDEPADGGFTAAVSARVHTHERLQSIMTLATYAGYALASLAIVFVCFGIVGRLLPAAAAKDAAVAGFANAPALALMASAPLLAAFGLAFAAVAYVRARD
jgi:hypothetical protein